MISDIANMIKSGFSSLVFESNEDACITNTFHCPIDAPTDFTYPLGVLFVAGGVAIVSTYALKLYTQESIELSDVLILENNKSVPTMENERAAMALADSESMAAEETERARLRAEKEAKEKRRAERAVEKAAREQAIRDRMAAANAALEREAAAKKAEKHHKRRCVAQGLLNNLDDLLKVDPVAAQFLQHNNKENKDPVAKNNNKERKTVTWRNDGLVHVRILSAGSSSSSGTLVNGLK